MAGFGGFGDFGGFGGLGCFGCFGCLIGFAGSVFGEDGGRVEPPAIVTCPVLGGCCGLGTICIGRVDTGSSIGIPGRSLFLLRDAVTFPFYQMDGDISDNSRVMHKVDVPGKESNPLVPFPPHTPVPQS